MAAQCTIHHPRRGEHVQLIQLPNFPLFLAASGCVDKNTTVWGVLLDGSDNIVSRADAIATPGGSTGYWLLPFTLNAVNPAQRYRLEVRDYETGELIASSTSIRLAAVAFRGPQITSPTQNSTVPTNFAAYGMTDDLVNPITGSINGTNGQLAQGLPPHSWTLYFQAVSPGTNLTLTVQQGAAAPQVQGLTVQ